MAVLRFGPYPLLAFAAMGARHAKRCGWTMTLETLLPFMTIAAIAGYFQTVTGFGLSMILMGASSGLEIAPVASVAAVVSLMAMVNGAVALPGKLKQIDWRITCATILGIVPSIVVGVFLLDYLSGSAVNVLSVALGLIILYGGVSLVLRPSRRRTLSSPVSFLACGVLSGLCSGLFGVSGPPVIYQFYRQPLPLVGIRNMLILLFTLTAGMRTLFIASQGQLDAKILMLTAWTIPVMAVATYVGRRWAPKLSAKAMRRVAFVTLVMIGSSLIVSVLMD